MTGITDNVRAHYNGPGLIERIKTALARTAPEDQPLTDQQLKGKTFGERYDQALETQEGMDEYFAREHPNLDTAAQIAGGIASTGAAAMTGAGAKALGLTGKGLWGMAKAGAKSGAVIGF